MTLRTLCRCIFPVFAGMVPTLSITSVARFDFPRIRGDGPQRERVLSIASVFSPYSRGWSLIICLYVQVHDIFPVFAGMVPTMTTPIRNAAHFPRIRGDGPEFRPRI